MNAHILVVEDDPAMRNLLVKVLRRARYKVVVAASGPAAVQLLAKSRFDLLVSDIRMSPMDISHWPLPPEPSLPPPGSY